MRSQAKFEIRNGNIFECDADIIICPVNLCPGVMGKGLAKEFASEFPGIRLRHKEAIDNGRLGLGRPYLCKGMLHAAHPVVPDPEHVVLFPTKTHWKLPSKLEYVFRGLSGMYDLLAQFDVPTRNGVYTHVAFPSLGCGLGGLPFADVASVMKAWAGSLPSDIIIELFTPRD